MSLATIPSPTVNAISLGPLTIHFYALCILTGIGVGLFWATKRWQKRGGTSDSIFDICFVAIIAGIIGARLYHVLITDPATYFGPGGNPIEILQIWKGGLGIGGAVVVGGLAAWVMCRMKGVSIAVLADSIAPALFVSQAIGRIGNWFNQELYGGPTDLPWGLDITCEQNGQIIAGCVAGAYHPTFLYEALWNLTMCVLVLVISERLRIGGGRVFWMYVMGYSLGRSWMETIRIDDAPIIAGLRIHLWVYLIVFLIGALVFAALTARYRRRSWEARRVHDIHGPTASAAGPDSDDEDVPAIARAVDERAERTDQD